MSLPSFSPPAALKILCLSMAILFFSTSECRAQFPLKREVAHNKLLFRVEVNKTTEESYTVKLVSVAKGAFPGLKSDANIIITDWEKDVFTAAISQLVREIWPDSLNYEEWEDAGKLDTLLANTFEKLESKRSAASPEFLNQLNYGLTEKEVEAHKKYKTELIAIQDSMRLFVAQRKLWGKYTDSVRARQEKLGKARTADTTEYGDVKVYHGTYKDDSLRIIEKYLKRQINRIDGRRKFIISLVGNSNVVSSFKSIDRSEINAGFGVIASKPSYAEFFGILTVAQTDDELKGNGTFDFGQCVLVPGVRKFSFMSSYRSYSMFKHSPHQFFRKLGFGFDINATPYKWQKDSNSVRVIPIALNIILPYTWILESEPGRNFAISTELGLTTRLVGGDAQKDQLKGFLENDKRAYLGAIIGINIKFNALRAQFHSPYLFSKERVPGLTHGQVYASIGIVGSLINDITGVLKDKKNQGTPVNAF